MPKSEIAQLIRDLYALALERPPRPEDMASWTARVEAGLSPAGMTAAIAASPEAEAVRARRKAAGRKPAAREIDEIVRLLYGAALDRAPEPGDAEAWRDHVVKGDTTVSALVKSIVTSSEAEAVRARRKAAGRKPAAREIDEIVRLLYGAALDRAPEPGDAEAWRNHVVNGDITVSALVKSIVTSSEAEAVRARRKAAGTNRASVEAAEVEKLVEQIYKVVLARPAKPDDVAAWTGHVMNGHITVPAMIAAIVDSPEADAVRARSRILPDISDGSFVQSVYEVILGRGGMADEIAHWANRIARGELGRDWFVAELFAHRVKDDAALAEGTSVENPEVALVLGTDEFISAEEWKKRADAAGADAKAPEPRIFPSLRLEHHPEMLVSAIASLYKGGDFIERFLDNVTAQSIFEHCELIIVDADSPENEFAVIERYMKRFPNIVYHRAPTRIGIYEAWNLGVAMARGRYVTNTNLDDMRRQDSFERQAEILEKFPFVDVVYQDFLFSFDAEASFATIAEVDVRSSVPIVTPYNLMRSNSPHNAPMWRRALHDDVGFFDTAYRSAGDYDFWLRCVQAGKVFCKVNDPHVVYFVNPQGLSTRPDTRGVVEANRITRDHGRRIVSPRLVCAEEDFLEELARTLGQPFVLDDDGRRSADWRYAAVQAALRATSASSRAAKTEGN